MLTVYSWLWLKATSFLTRRYGCLGLLHANVPVRVTLKSISFFLPRTPIKSISFPSLEYRSSPFHFPPSNTDVPSKFLRMTKSTFAGPRHNHARNNARELRNHSAIHNDGPTHPLHTPILRLFLKSTILLPTPIPRRLLESSVLLPTPISRHLLESPVLYLLRQVTPHPTQPRQEISWCVFLSRIRAHESRLP